ncbi:Retinol dehydrogenase 14 [Cladophialophora carrionii]|uniref:Retinol dehydrogenase 14 n=1 Tax=Cladophialophora carrionii TaxID=86049 RepID=A0A1C1D230_9EURO|nr:Retinol dehydrogenase 14 [Cladophialophora carrionii]
MGRTPPHDQGISAMWWSARNPPVDPKISFAGKTVLITGANVGLGLEAATKFARLGASRLILGVRSHQRGEDAKGHICQQSAYNAANVHIYQVDMSSFESVKSFATAITEEEPSLDIAVLNAGMAASSYQLSPDGYEMYLQVNVLSTALLAVLLLRKLHQSAQLSGSPSHLEFVGSVGHRMVKPTALDAVADNKSARLLDFVNDKQNFAIQETYCMSKVLLMYVMEGLVAATRRNNVDDVVITTCCPNLCRTNLGRDFNPLMNLANSMFQLVFARTAEEGSRILVSGTTLGKDAHGMFWSHDVFDM